MKKLFVVALLFLANVALAQPGKKPPPKEKPPTQKEMDEMMKEMQKAMDDISPEDKKMMDSMGVKMPDARQMKKNVAGVSDAQLKKAFDDESRIVPAKDASRIGIALSISLNNATMPAFINKSHLYVINQISTAAKETAVELVAELRKKNLSLSNTAFGFWIEGKPTIALYLMGEACKSEPGDGNLLNNYASMLTTCGAEELAIPILMNLSRQYVQNSTVLNNLGQAWLGLGDITRADKYADSALRIYPAHPQANMLKCVIEESKGNIPAAVIAARKSIKEAYSQEKEKKLKKLGYDLSSDDLAWEPPMERDAMGLDKFKWPAYPLSVDENKMQQMEWKSFKEDCQQKIDELKLKQAKAEKEVERMATLRVREVMQASMKGEFYPIVPTTTAKAVRKLGPLVNDVNGNMSFVFARELDLYAVALKRAAQEKDFFDQKQEALTKKYEDQFGEGKENPVQRVCEEENALRTEFLKNANGGLQTAYRQYLNYVSRRTGDLLYYAKYTMWPEQYELAKLNAQISWLTQIKDQNPYFISKSSWCVVVPAKKTSDSLQQFDDVACKYISKMNLIVYKITSACSNTYGEFDFKGIKMNIRSNVETGKYSGTFIVGVSQKVGPKAFEGKVEAAGLIEVDNTGFTDVGWVAGVSAKTGPVTIIGAEVKTTFNTGVTTTGKFLGKK